MLTNKEEQRLSSFLGVLRKDIELGFKYDPDIELKSYLWLAEKLKETNDELVQVHAELQKTNEDFANFVERYE